MKKRLFMAADDLTGALDSGVQFAKRGLRTAVRLMPWPANGDMNPDADAVIVCTDSRHVTAENARETVRSIFTAARKSGSFQYYFKKLDSTLRGNVGAEISGMAEALETGCVHVLNAFPAAGRTTKNGLQYVNGVPLNETAFARDPFNPIKSARIADVISSQADISDLVTVYDAETDADIDRVVADLNESGNLHCVAGCAGLADGIARIWHGENEKHETISGAPVILCGSLNPAADAQIAEAERAGVDIFHLPEAFITQNQKAYRAEASALLEKAQEQPVIIRTPSPAASVTDEDGAEMAAAMGRLFTALMETGYDGPVMVIGGDTLAACIRGAGWTELIPLGEALPGTAIFRCGKQLLLSKAGGFGDSKTIVKIAELMKEGIEL